MKKTPILWGIGLIIIAVLAGMYYGYGTDTEPVGTEQTRRYVSSEYGIAFDYPANYTLEERDVAAGSGSGRAYHAIILADTEALAEAPQNGEGPTTITIDIYQKGAGETAEQWVRNYSFSNFNISPDGVLEAVAVGGVQGLQYQWDGLYRGTSIAFEHKDNIVVLSGTYMEPSDAIRTDFEAIAQNIELQ